MNIKKPLLIAGVTTGLALSSMAGVAGVSAATSSADSPDSLVQKIAQKFNLKEADVKAVFEEERTARYAERQQKTEERLSQAVTDGKLTGEQKDKILAKQKELKSSREANREAMKDKTHEERKTAMQTQRAELEQWAKDNDIPTEYLHLGMGKGPGGPGHRGGEVKQD